MNPDDESPRPSEYEGSAPGDPFDQMQSARDLLHDDENLRKLLAWRHVRARCEADPEAFNGLLLNDLRAGDAAFDLAVECC